MLSEYDKICAAREVRELILASGQVAVQQRMVEGERLYGSDVAVYSDLGEIALEFIETTPADLESEIDAAACVLPETDIRTEDHLQISGESFRVQTVREERFFGVVTHQTLKLVKLHGR